MKLNKGIIYLPLDDCHFFKEKIQYIVPWEKILSSTQNVIDLIKGYSKPMKDINREQNT